MNPMAEKIAIVTVEFGRGGIRFNAVCPDLTMTEMRVAANERVEVEND